MATNDVVKSSCIALYFAKSMTRRVAVKYLAIQRINFCNYEGLRQKMKH